MRHPLTPAQERFRHVLRFRRKRLRLTQAQLAAEVPVAEITLRHWEQGIYGPGRDSLRRTYEVLDRLERELVETITREQAISRDHGGEEGPIWADFGLSSPVNATGRVAG